MSVIAVDFFLSNSSWWHKYFACISECYGLDIILYSDLNYLEIDQIHTVIIGRMEQLDDEVINCLIRLRLDLAFKGQILLVSFIDQSRAINPKDSDINEILGFSYIRLPFQVKDFVEKLQFPRQISDIELKDICQKLRTIQINIIASEITHNHINTLFLAITHFDELEKLSYYKSPSLEKILENFKAIQFFLTREKIAKFRADIILFLESLYKWKKNEYARLSFDLNENWKTIEKWFEISEILLVNNHSSLIRLFELAKATKTALKNIFFIIQSLKRKS